VTGAKLAAGRGDKVAYYRYKADSARRSLHGIDTQIAKAERAVAGKEPVRRNRFVKLTGGETIDRDLEAKACALAGLKAHITNMVDPTLDTRVRDRRLPPALACREVAPDAKHDLRARRSTTTSAS